MKATGIVRKIDDLGRIVLPKELRKTLNIKEGTPLEIYVEDNGKIVFMKYEPGCNMCGQVEENMIKYRGKVICPNCQDELSKM